MSLRANFADALRKTRKYKGLTQEEFSTVSSRTYLSTLERGLKSPTIDKIEELAGVLKIHPLSLMALAYTNDMEAQEMKALFDQIKDEVNTIQFAKSPEYKGV